MTRRHFQAFAEAIRCSDFDYATRQQVARLVADVCAGFNGRFDRERFTAAAMGFETYRVENKYTGKGHSLYGALDDALEAAKAECTTDASRWVVWSPKNERLAEVTLRGCEWKALANGER